MVKSLRVAAAFIRDCCLGGERTFITYTRTADPCHPCSSPTAPPVMAQLSISPRFSLSHRSRRGSSALPKSLYPKTSPTSSPVPCLRLKHPRRPRHRHLLPNALPLSLLLRSHSRKDFLNRTPDSHAISFASESCRAFVQVPPFRSSYQNLLVLAGV